MSYTHSDYLISTDDLDAAIQKAPNTLRIFDATINLVPAATGYKAVSGREDYDKEHIPGAAFFDHSADFSDTSSPFGFTLPSDDHLQAAYRAAGISADTKVVFYAAGHMMWATRAWWMLYSMGHKNVAVLDGGFRRWKDEGRAVTADVPSFADGDFTVQRNVNRWADKARVLGAVNDGDTCTINALSPDVYSGEADHSYGRRGHIENSLNVFYGDVMDHGCFKSSADLTRLFSQNGVLEKPRTIAYCGGGISATIDAFALALIGYENVAVYDGSMSEWAADENLPLIKGQS